jgi:hypothetical protein
MDPENITGAGLPDASQLNAPDPVTAVGNGAGTGNALEALSLAEINASLGKQFPNKEAALKSIKDTISYVGKKKEDIEKEVLATVRTDDKISQLQKEIETERKERFFDRNPQYADPSIRKLIDSLGGNPSDVVNREEFKTIFEKVSGYDKSAKLKTVLESNPRMVSSRDNLTKARESLKTAGHVTHEVQGHALNAVKEAFGL